MAKTGTFFQLARGRAMVRNRAMRRARFEKERALDLEKSAQNQRLDEWARKRLIDAAERCRREASFLVERARRAHRDWRKYRKYSEDYEATDD